MKTVFIDFTQIPIKKMGVGVYAIHTFGQLFSAKQDKIKYIALIQDDDADFDKYASDHVRLIKVKSRWFRNFFLRFFLEQIFIPFLVLKHKIDVVHSLHYSFPLISFGATQVITIHDLTFFIYPHHHTRVKRIYFKFFIWLSTFGKKRVVCVSQSTARDLVDRYKRAKNKIYVAELGKDENPTSEELSVVSEKFSLPEQYILFIGTLEPRKNIVGLINAYSLLGKGYPYKLVIVGKRGWYYDAIFTSVDNLNLGDRIIFTDFVSEHEKHTILKNATIFIYPSFYEGFGLPVLEALQYGIPTITSNVSSMPEVAGNAALLVDPLNYNDIAQAITRLTFDLQLQERLKTAGIERAKLFSWENTANKTKYIYDNC